MKVVIIEDEELTAEDLSNQLKSLDRSIQVVAILPSVQEAIYYIKKEGWPDLIFSDIQLQDGQSFEIFRTISPKCPIIFCTAYDEYAMDAIKSNGIDYIMKPFSKQDLERAIVKFKELKLQMTFSDIGLKQLMYDLNKTRKINSVLVYFRDRIVPIRLDAVAMFYKENDITYLKTFDGKNYPLDQTLDYFESAIGTEFFRVSRQVIIHHQAVKETQHLFNRKLEVLLKVPSDFSVEVSRNRVQDFLEWLMRT